MWGNPNDGDPNALKRPKMAPSVASVVCRTIRTSQSFTSPSESVDAMMGCTASRAGVAYARASLFLIYKAS